MTITKQNFKALPMPEWWARRGRCYLSGSIIIITHPDHAPLQWRAGIGEWTPQPNRTVLAVKSEDLRIWV